MGEGGTGRRDLGLHDFLKTNTFIKKHLSNIWSSIHEKVKQHWGWVEKKRYL